jgi:hypothetical protein
LKLGDDRLHTDIIFGEARKSYGKTLEPSGIDGSAAVALGRLDSAKQEPRLGRGGLPYPIDTFRPQGRGYSQNSTRPIDGLILSVLGGTIGPAKS